MLDESSEVYFFKYIRKDEKKRAVYFQCFSWLSASLCQNNVWKPSENLVCCTNESFSPSIHVLHFYLIYTVRMRFLCLSVYKQLMWYVSAIPKIMLTLTIFVMI